MMVLGGVGWDKKEFPESNLHVYGRDDTKIIVYNMERWLKEGRNIKKKKKRKKKGLLERKTGEKNPQNTGNCVHQ